MSDSRGIVFWIALGVFQLAFGLTVFGLTRQYYLSRPESPAPASSFAFPSEFQTAIESIPAGPPDADLDSPAAIANRANERFAAGDYAEAAVLYERLVELDPMNVPLLNNLGITLHYLDRSDEALQWLEQGVAIDPAHQRSWLTIGFINSQLGNTEEARKALTEAFRRGADNDIGTSAARMLRDMGFEVTLE